MAERHVDAIAQLHWLSENEGGRLSLPIGHHHAANMRFEASDKLWSVVILFLYEAPDDLRNQKVGLAFLFREKLEDELSLGKRISIFEGPQRKIAEGQILSIKPAF